MNKYRLSILAVLLGMASSAWAKGGYIYEYAGDVKVVVAGGAPRQASDSLALDDNTTVTTGNASRAVLKFEDGQVVVLKPNTTFLIKKYNFDFVREEKSTISFSLLKGGLRAITGMIGSHNKQAFKLSTPTATCGIRGTDFMLQTEGESMYGQVTSGAMTLKTEKSTGLFSAGQSSYVASRTAKPEAAKVAPLTFIQLQVIAAPQPSPAPVPAPGTKILAPNANEISTIARGINVPGVKPDDMATAMIQVGNSPTVVTSGVVKFAPKEAASITRAVIASAPAQAAAITSAAVKSAPTQAAAITSAAVTSVPSLAAAITNAAVMAAPDRAAAITTAAVTASPNQASAITTAAVTAAPSRAAAITSAAITVVPDQAATIVNAVGSAMPSKAGPSPTIPSPQTPALEQPATPLPASTPMTQLPSLTPSASGGGGVPASPNQ